jgi:hypothetical protein
MGTVAYSSALIKCGTFDVHYWSGGRHCDECLAEECVDGHGRSGERTASDGIEKRIHVVETVCASPQINFCCLVDGCSEKPLQWVWRINMKINSRKMIICLVFLVFTSLMVSAEECTTAIIGPGASAEGRPLLWKNRDTDILSNKVIFVKEVPYSYIGLVNASETSGRWVYAGLNSAGFGIMNSVAYNLEQKHDEMKDLEGQIMADALRTCRSVEDFEAYLQRNQGSSLGSLANFGVIDARGKAVIFEVHNHGFHKLDTADFQKKYLINTNYARSGKKGEGYGFLRFDRAAQLFEKHPVQKYSPELILGRFSRDLGHVLLNHPTLKNLENIPAEPPLWIYYRDCINRPYTSAATVISGRKPDQNDSPATLWVILGEPVTSIAVPLWVEAGEVPESLWKGKDAPLCAQAFRIKKLISPAGIPEKEYYMKINRLVNREGSGFLPRILKTEREVFHETRIFLKRKRLPHELAIFQKKMAQKAFDCLRKIK